ncbi:hypothetical protein [Sphingomonas morindae]|uniref:Uncharacterized protein n=1 Tax=Sphingomonas morindae TaxID=1541170 RepID=A0ABY4XCS2_9SPHN|nr:hypothetical protein [Sphingomonas morindae]USI74770.1 hypothetical protein LHA26_18645 [Sphingomonas morindae]
MRLNQHDTATEDRMRRELLQRRGARAGEGGRPPVRPAAAATAAPGPRPAAAQVEGPPPRPGR